ncbi:hypothetical protein BH11PLA2_BH11PLA2_23290 [soil metagenome]
MQTQAPRHTRRNRLMTRPAFVIVNMLAPQAAMPAAAASAPMNATTTASPAMIVDSACKRSPDCMIVDVVGGTRYLFTRKQRLIVARLFEARTQGFDFVDQYELLKAAESDQVQLRNVFKNHPAWGTLIVSGLDCGGPAGSYRIAPL